MLCYYSSVFTAGNQNKFFCELFGSTANNSMHAGHTSGSCRASTIEGNFLQNDHHFRGRGQYQLHILYNILKSSLSDFLSNSLPLAGQPYANTLWKRWVHVNHASVNFWYCTRMRVCKTTK